MSRSVALDLAHVRAMHDDLVGHHVVDVLHPSTTTETTETKKDWWWNRKLRGTM